MTSNDPSAPETGENDEQLQSAARKNRGVRFSDPEWEEVKQAALTAGITPAEFVRDRILDAIRNPEDASATAVPADLVPLVERTFRYTYMLATKMREDMIDNGKNEALENLVSEARKLQDTLQAGASD